MILQHVYYAHAVLTPHISSIETRLAAATELHVFTERESKKTEKDLSHEFTHFHL